MIFSRTLDMDLVRRMLTEDRVYRRMASDEAPAPEEFRIEGEQKYDFVIGSEYGQPVCLFLVRHLIEEHALEIHFCMAPEIWGRSKGIATQFLRWLWPEYPDAWGAIGAVPEHNRLALQLARSCGFQEYRKAPGAVVKNGKTWDLVFTKLERPKAA